MFRGVYRVLCLYVYFIVVVVTAFSVLWPKKVIIYNLVIDTLIPKYNARLAHPSGTLFYCCTGFSRKHFSSLCIHLYRSLHRDLKEYSSVFRDDTCRALY